MRGLIRYFGILELSILTVVQGVVAQAPCDPPLVASISVSGPVCAGQSVTLTFNLPEADDDEYFNVTYNLGGQTFTITQILNGHTVQHVVNASTTVTLLQVVFFDDDDDECFTNFNQSQPITVYDPQISVTFQNPGCNQSNGSITALASGGTSPYQYNLNGGPYQSSGTFTNLGAGTYTVGVVDGAGCTATATVTLVAPNAPTLSITNQQNPGCNQSNGSITALASGGTSPYQYNLNGGPYQSSGTFTNLGAGTYTVGVVDGAGCTATATVTLVAPNAPTLSITNQQNPGCNQSNGSITALASGGASPYQYNLNGGPYQSSGTFTNLGAGTYTVGVVDGAGCTGEMMLLLPFLNAPVVEPIVLKEPDCGQSNGSIQMNASGGSPP